METLAEDFLLVALDDDKGTVSWARTTTLPFGLGGAILMDLVLAGRVDSVDDKIMVRDPTPTGDAVLDAALETIRTARKANDAKHWVKAIGGEGGLKEQLAHRLVALGILRAEEHDFFWVFHSARFPTSDPGPETVLREQLRAVVVGNVEPEPRTLMLLSLVDACGMTGDVFPGDEQRQAKRRIKDLLESEHFGKAVGKAIAETVAEVAAATTAAAFSVTIAPGARH